MKRAIAFMIVLIVAVTGLYLSERRYDTTPVSANAIVAMAADTASQRASCFGCGLRG